MKKVNFDTKERNNYQKIMDSLQDQKDAIIIFDQSGRIKSLNQQAIDYFTCTLDKIIDQPISKLIALKTIAHKRLFCTAIKYFDLAKNGLPQQFHWVEYKKKQPILAYNVILNCALYADEKLIIARFINNIYDKTVEWVLWSLAEISNRGSIGDVIDVITKLASQVFNAEYAVVHLIDNQNISHSVSYFHKGLKQKNFIHSVKDAACEQVKNAKKICFFKGNVQNLFPKAKLLQKLNVNAYLGGPLLNAKREIVGLLTVMSTKSIDLNIQYKTLFRVFLDRISLEIDRLLSQRKLQFLATFPQENPNPVLRLQADGTVVYSNKAGADILDYWKQRNMPLAPGLMAACQRAMKTNNAVQEEVEINHRIYLFTCIRVEEFEQVNVYTTDISELKSTQQKIRDLANTDPLTNISNRQFFETTLTNWLEFAKINKEQLALLLLDLDNFKVVNDSYGHPIGDRLLKTLTRRISGCLREGDFIARLGGDEFVILLKIGSSTAIYKIANKINKALATPFELGEYHIETSCSIGISFYPNDALTNSELLKNADIAMYQAKKNGRNQYVLFSETKNQSQSKRRHIIKRDLKNPELAKQLYLDYQPQFDLKSKKIIGFEAFIRWRHPKEGLISPHEFLNLAEQTGSINSIGDMIIKKALQDYTNIILPFAKTKLSLNVALSQLNEQHFIDNLCENLDLFNLDNDVVVLDINDQISTVQYRHVNENLQAIHQKGIQLSLDNYSGSSSLSRLLEAPINFVKIDQNFLYSLETHPRNQAFISGIIELAKKLELQVIQKGVENQAQTELLETIGCPYAQGFYFCPPLPINALNAFLMNYFTN